MEGKTRFITRLSEIMKEKGYRQENLAKFLGMSQTAVSKWLKGDRKPNYETILLICAYLDETPNELLGYNERDIRTYRNELIENRIKGNREFQILCEQTAEHLRQEGKNTEEVNQVTAKIFQEKYQEFCREYDLET